MVASKSVALAALALFSSTASAATTYAYTALPDKWQPGQSGTNRCGTTSSQSSKCQNVIINDVDDFCLYGPPKSGGTIGDTERVEVSYCTKKGYGTRTFPAGTIKGAHFVKTPEYIQITGWGDFTKIGVKAHDAGGELDPHGADGNGNPIGGLVFSKAFTGKMAQVPEWTNFMSATEFCIRACNPASPNATKYCAHRYDTMGCGWNMPGNYAQGVFESCKGDSGEPMGIYTTFISYSLSTSKTTQRSTKVATTNGVPHTNVVTKVVTKTYTHSVPGHTTVMTWHQGQNPTPAAHPKPKVSSCSKIATIKPAKRTAMAPGPARETAF